MSIPNPRHIYDKTAVYPNLLIERLGDDFFGQLPSLPGVYWMLDLVGNILYIGQSKNLRKRLLSYAKANGKRVSPKIMRLVYHTAQIEWEICETAEAARLLENQLLRAYKPPYNRANTRPENYTFAGFEAADSGFCFALSCNLKSLNLENRYGAFKSVRSVRQMYSSLLRALWFATHYAEDRTRVPMALMSKQPPDHYEFPYPEKWDEQKVKRWEYLIKRYLKGTAHMLIEELSTIITDKNHPPESFLEHMARNDLKKLDTCYEKVTRKQFELIKAHGIHGTLIAQDELDDLLVMKPKM